MSTKMYPTWQFLILLSCYVIISANSELEDDISLFYQDSQVQPYSCSFELGTPVNFDCACVTGLWFLYDSCGKIKTISGRKQRCTNLNGLPVSKAVQIIKSPEELVMIQSNGTVRALTAENAKGSYIDNKVLLIAGMDWTIIDTSGSRICLSAVEANSYCFFSDRETSPLTMRIDGLEMGCDESDYFMNPNNCLKIGQDTPNTCEKLKKSQRIYKREAGDEATSGGDSPAAAPEDSAGAPASDTGSGNSSSILNGIIPEDEDYEALTANKTENSTRSPVSIEKGIIDYMTSNLDSHLALKNPEPMDLNEVTGREKANEGATSLEEEGDMSNDNLLNVTYHNPVYEFLELSKRITQKTCPPFYVHPEFLSLAVSTFIRMQQLEFKFPENSFKPSGFRRVLNALRECEAKAMPFNFSDADCNGKLDGKYFAYGQNLEMTITSDYADLSRDPIVETVWKVFFNAHSYCFPFFNKTLDHHRFTTWMIPLFQNQMNDLWTQGKTTNTSLSGLFEDQVIVQGNLGYCAVSSRLVSHYPWDLPRPNRVSSTGSATNGTEDTAGAGGDAANNANAGDGGGKERRRKRDIHVLDYQGKCLDPHKPMLCPTHIQYFQSIGMH